MFTSRRIVKTMMGPMTPPTVAARGFTALLGGLREPPGKRDLVRPMAACACARIIGNNF